MDGCLYGWMYAGVPFMVLGVDSSNSVLDGVPLRSKGSGKVESPLSWQGQEWVVG
jgi:hypothetical protein